MTSNTINGKYKFTLDGFSIFKTQLTIKKAPVYLLILTPFLIAPIFEESVRNVGYLLSIVFVIIALIIGFNVGANWFYSTIIDIDENRIIRFGKNLTTAELGYAEIGEIVIKEDGVRIYKKGLNIGLIFLLDKWPLSARDDLIFIPVGIDNFDAIINYIQLRVKKEKRA